MRASLPTEIVHAVRLPSWHALFAAFGYPSGVTSETNSLAVIADALARAELSPALARRLFVVLAFATEAGRADIYAAADAVAHASRWPDAVSPADLIVMLLTRSSADPKAALVLAAAQILRDRAFRPWLTQVYVGLAAVDPVIGEPTQYVAPLRAAFGAWLTTHDFGEIVSLTAQSVNGVFHYAIAHEDRVGSRAVAGDGDGVTVRSDRAIRSHLVKYEPKARGLTITTDCTEAITPLAATAGKVFFSNPRHFLDEPAVDLWRMQEHGAASLVVPEMAPKLAVLAIGGTWHSGKNHVMTSRGRDFFKAIARYKIRIEGGRLDLVTLRAGVTEPAGGPARCDVVVRPPHLLTVSEPELEPLMVDYLDRAKITHPEAWVTDFYSRQPWIDARAPWVVSEGEAGFAALLEREILRADPTNRQITPPAHPHAGRTATAYPLEGSKFLAWSPDPTIAPFVVDESDLVVYALSFAKFAEHIARALGLEGPATALDDDGVLFCGRRDLGPIPVYVSLATRPIRLATAERLRDAAGHGHALLIAPERRFQKHGLRQLAMPPLAGPWQPLLGAMVRTLRLEAAVETTLYAPLDARIVLHRATKRVWVDGVLCATLTETHFGLLEILITNAGNVVDTKDIAEHIAAGRQHKDTTRRAIDTLLAAITKDFRARKVKAPKDLRSLVTMPRLGKYILNAKGFID